MRHTTIKHAPRTAVPVYSFETDVSLDRIIRDPMAVLLGRSALRVAADARGADPYNRVGRFMRGRWAR